MTDVLVVGVLSKAKGEQFPGFDTPADES